MNYLRNALLFIGFALVISGCGGGSGTIANATPGGSTGTSSGGSVAGSSSGSITLQWTPPSTLADGTTAVSPSEISGYKIFYGTSATYTPNVISLNDGTKTQYTLTLPTGSYYFVICAVDTNGNPGLKSVALQKAVL